MSFSSIKKVVNFVKYPQLRQLDVMHVINSDHTSCTNHLKGGKVLSPAKRIALIGRAAGPVRFPLRPDRTAVKFTDQMRAKAFRL